MQSLSCKFRFIGCALLAFSLSAYSSSHTPIDTPVMLAQDEGGEAPPPPPPPEPETPPEEPPPPVESEQNYSPSSTSSSSSSHGKEDPEALAAEKALRYKNLPAEPISAKEKAANCRKYENQYISFHSKVFFIKGCKKYSFEIEEASQLSRNNTRVSEVLARVIASLDDGGKYKEFRKRNFNCRDKNHSYVSYDIKTYWVEGCKLLEFPDSATFADHRYKNKFFEKTVSVLDYDQFLKFTIGTPFKSVLTGQNNLDFKRTVNKIALQEACKNLYGRYVSYLDSVYQIKTLKKEKGCWREKVDAAEYSRKKGKILENLKELTSEQSLAIPDHDFSDTKLVSK